MQIVLQTEHSSQKPTSVLWCNIVATHPNVNCAINDITTRFPCPWRWATRYKERLSTRWIDISRKHALDPGDYWFTVTGEIILKSEVDRHKERRVNMKISWMWINCKCWQMLWLQVLNCTQERHTIESFLFSTHTHCWMKISSCDTGEGGKSGISREILWEMEKKIRNLWDVEQNYWRQKGEIDQVQPE